MSNEPRIKERSAAFVQLYSNVKPGEGECVLWTGPTHGKGYGSIYIERKQWYSHRLAFVLCKGAVNPGNVVMHSCDTPLCVFPPHLKQGTCRDNNHDAMRKNRTQHGVKHHNAKYNPPFARRVVKLLNSGRSGKEVAAIVGCSKQTVSKIKLGKLWRRATNA